MSKFIVFLVVGYIIFSVAFPASSPKIKYNSGEYQISEYSYSEGNPETIVATVLENRSQKKGIFTGHLFDAGVRSELAVLSKKAYSKLQEIEASGQCAASFLNQNARTILAVPVNSQVMSDLFKLSRGDTVELEVVELSDPVRHVDDIEIPIKISGAEIQLVKHVT